MPEKKERIRERNVKRVFVYDLNVFFSFLLSIFVFSHFAVSYLEFSLQDVPWPRFLF